MAAETYVIKENSVGALLTALSNLGFIESKTKTQYQTINTWRGFPTVVAWQYNTAARIQPAAAGFEKIRICPVPTITNFIFWVRNIVSDFELYRTNFLSNVLFVSQNSSINSIVTFTVPFNKINPINYRMTIKWCRLTT
jgi:hypothetical protein